jgi:inner membrane protein
LYGYFEKQSAFKNKKIIMSSVKIALRVWFLTSIAYFIAAVAISLVNQSSYFISLVILPLSLLITLPAFLGLWFTFSFIAWIRIKNIQAWLVYCFSCSLIVIVYSTLNIAFLNELLGYDFAIDFNIKLLWSCSYLSFCVAIASLFSIKFLQQRFHQSSIKNNNMEQNNLNSSETLEASTTNPPIIAAKSSAGNSTLIKAIIMAIMVVVLLIPTLFITNLVDEREKRQATVVQEVSSKWASDQTIGTPFIHLLYSEVVNIENSKKNHHKRFVFIASRVKCAR